MAIEKLKKGAFSGTSNIFNGFLEKTINQIIDAVNAGGGGGTVPAWGDITGKPAVIAAGADQSAARQAIGAGTSNLAIGTGANDAAAGNHTHADLATQAALEALEARVATLETGSGA